jgi:hypothetical protein
MKHHVKPHIPTEPEAMWRICWSDFGDVNPETGGHEIACQVRLPDCTHIFGYFCLLKLFATEGSCCPFGLEQWCTPYAIRDRDDNGKYALREEVVLE